MARLGRAPRAPKRIGRPPAARQAVRQCLLDANGEWVTSEQLARALYGDASLNSLQALWVAAWRLAREDARVQHRRGRGYRLVQEAPHE